MKYLKILIIILIIIAAGFGGYIIIKNKTNKSSPGIVNINAPKTKIWKTYANEKYNYALTYSSDLVLTDGKYDQDNVLFKDVDGLTPDVVQISVSLTKNRNIFTFDDWTKNYSQEGYFREQDIIIDRIPAIVFGLKIGDDVTIKAKGIIFFKDDNLFTVNFHATDAPELSNNSLVQYFSTHFKFKN